MPNGIWRHFLKWQDCKKSSAKWADLTENYFQTRSWLTSEQRIFCSLIPVRLSPWKWKLPHKLPSVRCVQCKVYLVWCKVFNSLRHNLYVIGQMSLLKMAKYWKHNLAIWSHCLCTPIETMIIVTSSRQPLFVKWLKIPRILRALRFSSVRVVRPRFKVVRPGS